ncbi:histone arginine methyltransferase PRMT3 [Cardiosporidium cionae]|uniref:Histone arginine methyltransferase PRMT3 n=1 Tax=Cardiosporidium cionae TaxID=476202 RepID=A0ABQ7JG01_9APIC|nr:histone arginine methyltransferase PRMT3 [Cardiosporidium cionae]|eukprot:KAF8822937.1 histone arginine methyltransferase PRMT3 [Cardiosporidium cionae]
MNKASDNTVSASEPTASCMLNSPTSAEGETISSSNSSAEEHLDPSDASDVSEEHLPYAHCLFDKFHSVKASDVWARMRVKYNFKPELLSLTDYTFVMLINYLRTVQLNKSSDEALYCWRREKLGGCIDTKFLISPMKDDRLLWDFPEHFISNNEEECLSSPEKCENAQVLSPETAFRRFPQEGEGITKKGPADKESTTLLMRSSTTATSSRKENPLSHFFEPPVIHEEFSLEEENKILNQKLIVLMAKLQEMDCFQDVPLPTSGKQISTHDSSETHSNSHSLSDEKNAHCFKNGSLVHTASHLPSKHHCASEQAYFDGYGHLSIHREMILDDVRTEAYKQFILSNSDLFKGKVILDIGCGSGILSLFAAQAGANLVIAVDASKGILNTTRKVVKENGYEHIIKVLFGKLEEMEIYINKEQTEALALHPDEAPPAAFERLECDVIVSEWMGYCLFYESMLYTVLNARNRYLKPGGYICPNEVILQVYGADYSSYMASSIDIWSRKLYGFDLSALKPSEWEFLTSPELLITPKELMRTPVADICKLNLHTITEKMVASLDIPFELNSASKSSYLTSLGISFHCQFCTTHSFPGNHEILEPSFQKTAIWHQRSHELAYFRMNNPIGLKTDPMSKPTHWKQCILHLYDPSGKRLFIEGSYDSNRLTESAGSLRGSISISRDKECHRNICLAIQMKNIKQKDSYEILPATKGYWSQQDYCIHN